MFIVKHKNFFLILTVLLVAASLFIVNKYGLKYSIEFTGGSITEVAYGNTRPPVAAINDTVKSLNLGSFLVQPIGKRIPHLSN